MAIHIVHLRRIDACDDPTGRAVTANGGGAVHRNAMICGTDLVIGCHIHVDAVSIFEKPMFEPKKELM